MEAMVGKVLNVADIDAPTKRGTDAKAEADYQVELAKFNVDKTAGIKKKIHFSVSVPVEIKGGKIFEEIRIYALKTKDTGLKLGDRILVQGRTYELPKERGFTKTATVEVLSEKK